jgi:hypothetical protein
MTPARLADTLRRDEGGWVSYKILRHGEETNVNEASQKSCESPRQQ